MPSTDPGGGRGPREAGRPSSIASPAAMLARGLRTARDKIARLSANERGRRVVFAAAAGVAQRLVGALGTFLMFPLVLHALGTDGFGVWGAATSLILLITVADFGVGSAIVTLVAHAVASEDADEPRDFFTAALVMACAIAVFLALAGGVAAACVAPRAVLPAYLIAVAGVSINVPLGAAQAGWLALQRGWMAAMWDLLYSIFLIAGLVAAITLTRDPRFYVAVVYGALLSANALSMTWLLMRHPELRPTDVKAAIARLGTVVGTGLRYFIVSMLDGLSYMLDNVIALQLLGAAASARMLVAQRVCVAALGLLMMVAQPLWPAFVDAAARGDRQWMFRALTRGTLLVTAVAVSGAGMIILAGPALLRFWLGTSIGIDRSILWVMAFWIVSLALVRVRIALLNALRFLRFQIAVFAIATLISLSLKFALAPRFGVAGILFATAATFPIIILPAMLWRISRWRRGV